MLTAPYFLFNATQFYFRLLQPPDSFQRPQGGGSAHFEKHCSKAMWWLMAYTHKRHNYGQGKCE